MDFRPLLPLALLLAACLGAPSQPAPAADSNGTAVLAVVHPLAAEAGAEMLRRGGNAVDAAAAVQWALNVVEPSMSGLGGGTLILYWDNVTKTIVYLDGRETAPAASTHNQFLTPNGEPQAFDSASTKGYAVGVPGTLRVFERALRELGRLNLSDTFAPAIAAAEGGFEVDAYLAGYIAASEGKLRSWPASAKTFVPGSVCPPEGASLPAAPGCVGGSLLKKGDRLVQRDLGATFRLLQTKGAREFYNGTVATAIVAAQAEREGRMVGADLARYEARKREPVRGTFENHSILSTSPPSAGGLTLLEMLHILDPLPLAGKEPLGADVLHTLIEAAHLAYADRFAYIGDSDHVFVPMKGLLDPRYAAERRALIDPKVANPGVRAGDPWKYDDGRRDMDGGEAEQGGHTSHFTVVDRWGNIASVTTTLESLFGTGMVVPGYGFFLNNQMTDFDFRPGGPNQVEPGKRPRSSMTPTLVFDEEGPVLALGSPGGPTITTTVLQVLVRILAFGETLPEAVSAPRIYSAVYPTVEWEAKIPAATREALRSRGHQFAAEADPAIGNVQGLALRPDGSWLGVADNRAGAGSVVYVPPTA